jgi:hypothetical protein
MNTWNTLSPEAKSFIFEYDCTFHLHHQKILHQIRYIPVLEQLITYHNLFFEEKGSYWWKAYSWNLYKNQCFFWTYLLYTFDYTRSRYYWKKAMKKRLKKHKMKTIQN